MDDREKGRHIMERDELALEEIKLLQEIIGRHEGHAMRAKGLFFVIIAGLTAAIYAEGLSGSRPLMFAGAIVLTFLFMVWELYHRAISQHAITRAGEVEEQLRLFAEYDGPKIGLSLRNRIGATELLAEARRPWNWSSLVVVLSSLGFLFLFAPPPKDGARDKPSNAITEQQTLSSALACPTFHDIQRLLPARQGLGD
jgi:hypothetical protein